MGSPDGSGTEPRSGNSGTHERRVGHAPRSDASAGAICPWLGAKWPDGVSVPRAAVSLDFRLRHGGDIFGIGRTVFKLGRQALWYQPDDQIPRTPGSRAGFPCWPPPALTLAVGAALCELGIQ